MYVIINADSADLLISNLLKQVGNVILCLLVLKDVFMAHNKLAGFIYMTSFTDSPTRLPWLTCNSLIN